jgi:hypothetical protein
VSRRVRRAGQLTHRAHTGLHKHQRWYGVRRGQGGQVRMRLVAEGGRLTGGLIGQRHLGPVHLEQGVGRADTELGGGDRPHADRFDAEHGLTVLGVRGQRRPAAARGREPKPQPSAGRAVVPGHAGPGERQPGAHGVT